MMANQSPAPNQSSGPGQSWHTLILSDHGRVQSVDVGMYFINQSDKTFSLNVSTPGNCNMTAISGYPTSQPYLYIKIGTLDEIPITGNQACSTSAPLKLDGRSFTIPGDPANPTDPLRNQLRQNFKGTAFWGVKVTIRWVDGSDPGAFNGIRNQLANAAGGVGSNMRFRFNPSSGKSGYVDTNSATTNVTNNSIVHTATTNSGFENMFYPFGLSCNNTTGVSNGSVTVYDADNGAPGQDPSLYFFVGKVADNSTSITPLRKNDYRLRTNGTIWYQEDPNNEYRNPPQIQTSIEPTRVVSFPNAPSVVDSGSVGNLIPVFTPSGFNNAGGSTTVQIDRVDPQTHYVLVVARMHAGQFIYVGLPGDAVFGDPSFNYGSDCPPSGSLSCDQLTVTPGTVVDGSTPITTRFVAVGSPPVNNVNMNLTVTGPVGFVPRSFDAPQAGNPSYTVDYAVGTLPTSGEYTLRGTVSYTDSTGTANSDECTATVVVANRPYFQITGGDILSGDSIRSWNLNGGLYSGGNSQLGALATNRIADFVTGRGLSAFGTGTGLAFANTTTAPPDIYGGGYQITPFSPFLLPQTAPLPGGGNLAAIATSGVYYVNNNLTLHGQLPTGVSATIIITSGDAFIDGPITYGAYNSLAQIPSLKLYVMAGDIIVRNDVSLMHGVYYAGDSAGVKGKFYSCGNAAGSPMDMNLATAFQDCNTKLVVYGSVSAAELVLNRTYGDIVGFPSFPQEPAEEFIYSPELWLAPRRDGGGSNDIQYDSFVSLPPIL